MVSRGWRIVADRPRQRWIAYAIAAAVLAFFVLFPRPYVARASIVPQDTAASAASTTALLGALGGSAQNIGSLLSGGKPSNDLYMVISRSTSVKDDAIRRLGLVGPKAPFANNRDATLWMEDHVNAHLLLGGVIEIETKLYDPEQAQRVTGVYAEAIGRNLATFGKQIIANKRRVVSRRFGDASQSVAIAEGEVSAFRRANNLAEPEQQLSTALTQRAGVEAQLQSKEVALQTQRQFLGPENPDALALQSDVAGLRAQLARTANPSSGPTGPNVAGLTAVSLRYLNLYRNLRFHQAMYDIYQRSAEQVAVEELATESASYIQTIDAAHIVPERQLNNWAIAVLAGLVLLVLFVEWYGPTTGLIPRLRPAVLAIPDEAGR